MHGWAYEWTEDERYASCGTIQTKNGDWYRVQFEESVEPDCIGRRFLVPNEPVQFDEGPEIVTNRGKRLRQAVNVTRPWKESGIDPATHREICWVVNRYHIQRQLGGRLRIDFGELPADHSLSRGNIVACGVRDSGGSKWDATAIVWLAKNVDTYTGSWEVPL